MTLAVNIAQGGSNNVTMRNRIINGAMVIDQRNAGASFTPTDQSYSLDRWKMYVSQASKYTVQQSATTPAGFSCSLLITSSSAYTVGASERFMFGQGIEGYNVADLGFGTANAKTVTLSFWVRSSLTGTFGGSLGNVNSTRTYPFSYTISSANTWEQKTITVAGDTSGTWNVTTDGGLWVYIGLGVGSTYSGTAGSWSGSAYYSVTGATSVVGTSGATFYITGVQLEAGTTASPFEYRQYGTELNLCQRYCFVVGGASAQRFGVGWWYNSTNGYLGIPLPVAIRDQASIAISYSSLSHFYAWNGTTATTPSSISLDQGSTNYPSVVVGVSSGGSSTGGAVVLSAGGGSATSARIYVTCEL